MKMIFQSYLRPEEYYFGIKCKRLKPGDVDNFRYYVDKGVDRCVDGVYSPNYPVAILIGYLMEPFEAPAEAQIPERIITKYFGVSPLDVWPELASPYAALVSGEVPRVKGAPMKLIHAMLPMLP